MKSYHASKPHRSARRLSLCASTALPLLLAASPVMGQSIVKYSDGNIQVDADRATGEPLAVDLYTSEGAITASVDSVEGDAAAGIREDIVYLETDAGPIQASFGSITGTGEGYVLGVEAYSWAGDIDISVGDLTLEGTGTSGVQARSMSGDVVVRGENVLLRGEGGDPENEFFPEGLLAGSVEGAATVIGGTVETRGLYGSAALAIAGTDASVTVENAIAHSDGAVAVHAEGGESATIAAGSVSMLGDGVAVEAFSAEMVSVDVQTLTSAGGGIYTTSATAASIAVGTVDAVQYGIWSLAGAGSSIDIAVTDGVTTSGDLSTAIYAATSGDVTIDAASVTVTGDGAPPGLRDDGYRLAQGGIVVEGEGGNGTVSIDAGTIDVAGEERYGISVRGNGAITINADDVTLASADSVAVVARAGEGDVSISTGTVVTTGASGTGVYADTTSGNIMIDAGTTRVEHEGQVGWFTGEAVSANSDTGSVSIKSADAFTAGFGGSAIYGNSGGDVSVVSAAAQTTGDSGIAVAAVSGLGNARIESAALTTTGANTRAILAMAANGVTTVQVGNLTASGEGAEGILAIGGEVFVTVDGAVHSTLSSVVAQGGKTDVRINGTVSADEGAAIVSSAQDGYVDIAEGAAVSGAGVGAALLGGAGGFTRFYNSGSVTAADGPAVAGVSQDPAGPASFYLRNNGVLTSGIGVAILTGVGDDVLELTEHSVIHGIVNLGDGDDRLVLDVNDDAPATAEGQVVATVNVETLSVDSGTWRATAAQSQYAFVNIEDGATLTIGQSDEGEASVEAPDIEVEGILRVDFNDEDTDGDFFTSRISGDGSVHIVGSTTMVVEDASGLEYTGGTFVEKGGFLLQSAYDGDVETSGEGVFEIGESGDFTGNLVNDGTFVFSRDSDYAFLGDFSGSGLLRKGGDGVLTFAGLYAFSGTTSVLGGSVAFTGQLADDTKVDLEDGTFDLSQVEGGQQTVGQLSGEGGTVRLGGTELVINQSADTSFSGAITGSGALVKSGEGDLKLNGDGTGFTGSGQVQGGTLSINGNFSNANFLVNEGGTLGGAGMVGDVALDGGTLAPGNSIDTLTVAGNVAFNAASVFQVEVNAEGESDLLRATGTATLGGAAVEVIGESGAYRPLTDYTILIADGGLSGTFGSVETNLAFLDPSLSYSDNVVTLRLVRNDIDFAAFGQTANQRAIGNLIESFGYGNALYNEALTLVDQNVAVSFASLTGEIYPAYGAALIETAEMLRRQTTGSMEGQGAYGWATGLYHNTDSKNGPGAIELSGKGMAGGIGFGGNGFSMSAGLGTLDNSRGGGDFVDGDVTFAIGRLGYSGPAGLSVSAGVQVGWTRGTTRRSPTLGAMTGPVNGKVDGDYLQLFGEVGYSVPLDRMAIEPFVGISHVSLEFDDMAESGSPTALSVSGIDRQVTFGNVGLRVSGGTGPLRPFVSAAYRHAWGDRASNAAMGFAGTTGTTLIHAVPIARSGADLAAGLAVSAGALSIEVSYKGMVSQEFDSHGLSAGLKFRF